VAGHAWKDAEDGGRENDCVGTAGDLFFFLGLGLFHVQLYLSPVPASDADGVELVHLHHAFVEAILPLPLRAVQQRGPLLAFLCPLGLFPRGIVVMGRESGGEVTTSYRGERSVLSTRTKSLRASLLFALLGVSACTGGFQERPGLVVYVVVDQLRGDLLERYDSLFTGGFRRLHDEGFRFLSVTHDHAKTSTAAGHATLSTGVFPFRSGIVANEWLERTADGWRSVYSVEDTLTHILGLPVLEGRSPKNLLRGGLADWIAEADSGAIVVSASRKDRAAITMAGKTRGHVYWITENQGRFVTSGFYADDYPAWVVRVNRDEMPRIFGDSIWEQTMPEAARALSRGDTAEYEGDGGPTGRPIRMRPWGFSRRRPFNLSASVRIRSRTIWAFPFPRPMTWGTNMDL